MSIIHKVSDDNFQAKKSDGQDCHKSNSWPDGEGLGSISEDESNMAPNIY